MRVIVVLLICASLSSLSYAQTDAERGLAIATEMKQRDTGWQDTQAKVEMILRDPQGRESIREMRVSTLEVVKGGDKSLTVFDQPRDVAGTAFLSHSKLEGSDDQWLYLPAIKRIKRIASRNKSGPFMGSEFAYEDMTSFELAKFTFRFVQDDIYKDMPVFIVEQIPTDPYSGYSRMHAWVDKEHYRVHKITLYDRKNSLLKTLRLDDYRQYKNKFWRAHRAEMLNHQTQKSTLLKTSDLVFDTGVSEQDFEKNVLRRIR